MTHLKSKDTIHLCFLSCKQKYNLWPRLICQVLNSLLPFHVYIQHANLLYHRVVWTVCVCVLSHVWFYDPRDCSSLGSSVHATCQAGILEWADISSAEDADVPDPGKIKLTSIASTALADEFLPLHHWEVQDLNKIMWL